jgi:hypothetical protein
VQAPAHGDVRRADDLGDLGARQAFELAQHEDRLEVRRERSRARRATSAATSRPSMLVRGDAAPGSARSQSLSSLVERRVLVAGRRRRRWSIARFVTMR